MPVATNNELFTAIKAKAIALWGENRWLHHLVREYCRIEGIHTGTEPKPNTRHNTIARLFEADTNGSRTDTLFWLLESVGLQMNLSAKNEPSLEERLTKLEEALGVRI